MWRKFDHKGIVGTRVYGDTRVASTNLFNWLYMKFWGWKTAIVFHVGDESARCGYRIGYQPIIGNARLNTTVFHDKVFRVRIGREDCVFFAVDRDLQEVSLRMGDRTPIKGGSYQIAPLR